MVNEYLEFKKKVRVGDTLLFRAMINTSPYLFTHDKYGKENNYTNTKQKYEWQHGCYRIWERVSERDLHDYFNHLTEVEYNHNRFRIIELK